MKVRMGEHGNPHDKENKREAVSGSGVSKRSWQFEAVEGVIDVTEQRDWPPRASWVDKVAEKGDILTLGD